jgi:acyl-CoA thioester hydrolase
VPEPFVHELRVRYGECDPQGIVFNANYLLYLDVAFTELFRAVVGSWMTLAERGVDLVIAEMNLRFRGPARYDDVLQITPRFVAIGTTSLQIETEIARDGRTLLEARGRQVCVDATTWEKTELPGWLRDAIEPALQRPAVR